MSLKRFKIAICLIAILAPIGILSARPVPAWPYDVLFEKSDLVVIVEPTAIREAVPNDNLKAPDRMDEYFDGIVTSFKVLVVVKGTLASKSLDIKHFVLTPKGEQLGNGPVVVSFEIRDPKKSYQYMLFLRKLPNGDFEFVTGQHDSAFSVKQLRDSPRF